MDLDLRGELFIGGVWVDATGKILKRQSLTHTRGRQDQGARVDPSTLRPLLNNTDGRFSPDNPMGPYYGQFGRNTPFRLSLAAGSPFLDAPGGLGDHASTPDDASLDITSDIDVRLDATLLKWVPSAEDTSTVIELFAKYSTGGRSWLLGIEDGALFFRWSPDGTSILQAESTTLPIPASGRLALRATLDVDNGAGGRTAAFYTAPSMAGPWTQLGDPVVQSGTTSIANTTTAVRVGDATDFASTRLLGRVHKAEVRNGIDGSVVATPDFTAQTIGATSFVDSAGRTWTMNGGTSITNRRTRLSHELAAYPTEWHPSGKHAWVSATTAGILRRLRRGEHALDSTLRRRIPSFGPLAYWPMEEGASATQAYSPIPGVRPLTLTNVNWAGADSLASSNPLPVLASSGGDLAVMRGTIPAPAAALTSWEVDWVYRLDNANATDRTFMRILSTGTVAEWIIQSSSAHSVVKGLDSEGTQIFSQNIGTGLDLFGQWVHVRFLVAQNGGNVEWDIVWADVGGDAGTFGASLAGTAGRPTGVASPAEGFSSDLDGMAIGHISVWPAADTFAYFRAIDAWTGETAGERMQRLADEETIPLTVCGVVAEQTLVGPQRPDAVLNLLEQAGDADGGILYEDREQPTLRYRDRAGMYNQTPALVLDYNAPGLAPPLKPTGDDDATENDVTVNRVSGSSARAVLEEGPMSVQAPPNGVGTGYDSSYTLNLHSDDQAEPHAYWRMWLGTYEGRRYPQVHVMVHRASPEVVDQILNVDVGDKLVIQNPPVWVAPGDIELIVQGYEESWAGPFQWDIVFTCTPGAPWNVGQVGDGERGRVDANPSGSTLAVATDADDTLIVVHTPARGPMGPAPWITSAGPAPTYPAEFPYDIRFGGETARVLANAPVVWDAFGRAEAHGAVLNANPTFEEDLDGWTGSGATLERVATPELASVPFSGQWSMQITPDGVAEFPNAGSDMIAVTAGTQYNLSGWLLCATSRNVALNINWFDAVSGYLSTSSNDQAVTADTWTHFTLTATAPVGAAFANLAPTVPDFPPTTDVTYADQVEFSAVVADTWGRSDGPSTWAETGGLASDRSLNGTAGVITLAATPATIRFQRLVAGLTDTEVLVRMSVGQVATGNALLPSVLLRYVDTSNFYRARVHFGLSGAMSASITRATTAVGSTATLPYTYAAGDWFWVRARITGQRVQLRVWPDGQLEPAVWHKDETIASDTIASGQVGVTASAFDTNTNVNPQLRFDDFTVVTPQLMTVQRSLNGVVKAHAVGAEVRLAQPAVVAL